MYGWKKIRLGDVCSMNANSYSTREAWNFVNYLDTGNITDNIIDSIQYIDIGKDKLPSRAKRKVKENSVIVSTVRPNQRHFGIIKNQPENFLVSTGFVVIDVNDKFLDADFLYYSLSQKTIIDSLQTIAEQSTTSYPSISASDIENLEIEVPDILEQKRIAYTLRCLDLKIKQNNKVNDNLEKQAKLVYDYWFNQFEFPDENGKPYKSSGGSMVWNGELSREIPEGWKVKTLRHVILNAKNGDWGNENYKKDSDIKVKCFRGADFSAISQEHQISAPTRYIGATHADRLLSNGDLVIEVSGGSPSQSTGRVGYINDVFIERCEGSVCCSNFCKAFTPLTLDHQFWLYFTWKSLYDSGLMFNYEGKTTGIKNLLFETLINSVKIAVPNTHLLKKFNGICSCMYAKIQKSLIESENLSSIRDSLLPLLMNGQAIVRD